MKTLINYVVQDSKEHKHESEIMEITSPPYTFSPEPSVCEVMKWAKKKQNKLRAGHKFIFKVSSNEKTVIFVDHAYNQHDFEISVFHNNPEIF